MSDLTTARNVGNLLDHLALIYPFGTSVESLGRISYGFTADNEKYLINEWMLSLLV